VYRRGHVNIDACLPKLWSASLMVKLKPNVSIDVLVADALFTWNWKALSIAAGILITMSVPNVFGPFVAIFRGVHSIIKRKIYIICTYVA
jgi:hypothetical protein